MGNAEFAESRLVRLPTITSDNKSYVWFACENYHKLWHETCYDIIMKVGTLFVCKKKKRESGKLSLSLCVALLLDYLVKVEFHILLAHISLKVCIEVSRKLINVNVSHKEKSKTKVALVNTNTV